MELNEKIDRMREISKRLGQRKIQLANSMLELDRIQGRLNVLAKENQALKAAIDADEAELKTL